MTESVTTSTLFGLNGAIKKQIKVIKSVPNGSISTFHQFKSIQKINAKNSNDAIKTEYNTTNSLDFFITLK